MNSRYKSFRHWLRGLINAGISGGTVVLSTMSVAPDTFNFNDGLSNLLKVAGVSAIVSILKFVSSNPLPIEDIKE